MKKMFIFLAYTGPTSKITYNKSVLNKYTYAIIESVHNRTYYIYRSIRYIYIYLTNAGEITHS